MSIYTGTGDKGKTRLLSGEQVLKADPMVEAYGTLDELTAQLGVCRALISKQPAVAVLADLVIEIQRTLFQAGMQLSCHKHGWPSLKSRIAETDIKGLENTIDGLETFQGLPRFFVSPGKTLEGAALHLARTVCRRAERRILAAVKNESGYEAIVTYINRLSDLLFALAWVVDIQILIYEEIFDGNYV